ncbi:DUF7289 family protein [Halorussus amylolyticus]|uniref:DUF7289 family protein n=1 Tax=Halorussus amylolyticus TaxID=1126242 RepID=UPI001042B417|nr:hypothetical protein [Halorussus amylolyticus]
MSRSPTPTRGNRTASVRVRGQSEVLSVVLLLGITIAGTGLIVAFGSSALDDSKQSSELDSAEHAMTQLDSKLSLVGLGDSTSQTVSLGVDSTTRVDDDTGWMRVEVVNRTDETVEAVVLNRTLGAVVYENGETTVAYQGGGVWRRSDAGSAMVSPPEFHYRGTTLTLPLVAVNGTERLDGRAHLAKGDDTDAKYPVAGDPDLSNPLEDGKVNVTVDSAYYDAWGRFFEDRTGGEVSYDHDRERVTITLVVPGETKTVTNALAGTTADRMTIQGAGGSSFTDSYNSSDGAYSGAPVEPYNGTIVTKGSVTLTGGAEIYGDLRAGGTADLGGGVTVHGNLSYGGPPPNCKGGGGDDCRDVTGWVADNGSAPDISPIGDLVDIKAETYRDGSANDNDAVTAINETTGTWNDSESTLTLPSGAYYLENGDLDGSRDLTFDTSDGDVVLVVDDEIEWNGANVDVTDPEDGTVKVYTTGSEFRVIGGATVGDTDGHVSPSLRVYAGPGLDAEIEGDSTLVGLVYAPGTDAQSGSVTVTSQAELYGGIVGGGQTLLQSGGSVHFDQALSSVDPVDGEASNVPQLTYLHVSVSEVNVTRG